MRRAILIAVLVLFWGGVAFFVHRAWQRIQRQSEATNVCGALDEGRLEDAVEDSDGPVETDEVGLRVVECRSLALFGLGRREESLELLEATLKKVPQWQPAPILAAAVIETSRSAGQLPAALEMLDRALREAPQDPLLLSLELAVRAELEDEAALLAEMEARLPEMGGAAPLLRIRLAERHLGRKSAESAARLLGREPPMGPGTPEGSPWREEWFRARMETAAMAGRPSELRTVAEAWREAGGKPAEVLAMHAVLLSSYSLQDLQVPTLTMLQQAAAQSSALRLEDRAEGRVLQAVFTRLVGTYAVAGETDRALEVFEREKERLGLDEYFDADEIRRAAISEQLDDLEAAGTVPSSGSLRFRLAVGSSAPPGAVIALSPDPGESVDTPYRELPFRAPEVTVDRRLGKTPQRWVLRDGAGAARASGSIWPVAGGTVEVEMHPGPPRPVESFESARAPPDGRRRVFVVVLDCGDWRLIRYLLARGELPALGSMIERGTHGVLASDPPSTAIAMEALVYPGRREAPTVLGLLHQLGDELAGLSFVGENPFSALGWVIPSGQSLFEVVGAGDRVAVNLLFSRGKVSAGRHGETVGPRGVRGRFLDWRSRRPLTPSETRRFPGLQDQDLGTDLGLVEEAAADLDAAVTAARGGEIDFLMERVASLDIFTHGSYRELARGRQDDAEYGLYAFYRYLDFRLGRLEESLDQDDVLIVLSDHGIESTLLHDRHALFVAVGGGVPAGRLPGTPDLGTVPWLLARLLGLEMPWPPMATGGWLAAVEAEQR